jgi:hypothetical protein
MRLDTPGCAGLLRMRFNALGFAGVNRATCATASTFKPTAFA